MRYYLSSRFDWVMRFPVDPGVGNYVNFSRHLYRDFVSIPEAAIIQDYTTLKVPDTYVMLMGVTW